MSVDMELSVNKRMELAVNAAMAEYQVARQRQNMIMASNFQNVSLMNPGLDAKRSGAWAEFGWPACLNFVDFYKLYARGGIAAGAVNKLTQRCWGTVPQIVQGDKDEKDKEVTPWEDSLKPVLNRGRLWSTFKEADKRRLIGRYSAIILRIRDSKAMNQPATKGRGLAGFIVAWAGSISPAAYYDDMTQDNYGEVKMWKYSEPSLSGQPGRDVDIHPDRVFILGDWRADAIGFLEPVFNNFVNLEKTEGGSGESILKNSNRSVHVNFDGTVDLRNMASMYGVSLEGLQEKFNETAREVNQGNDILFVTQGATATPLVANVPNPVPIYEVNLNTVSAGVDIPSKILIGNQSGDRASSEDERYMNRRCQSRRINELSFEIQDFFDKLILLKIVDAAPGPDAEYSVIWDDLSEATFGEKLDNAKKMSEINEKETSSGMGAEIFVREQILGAVGLEDMLTPADLQERKDDKEAAAQAAADALADSEDTDANPADTGGEDA